MNKNQTNKFINKTFFEPYPSDPIPPRLFDTMKVHKPEKNIPMQANLSAICTPSRGISNL